MTHPTKAIAPLLLEDYRKITTERKVNSLVFSNINRRQGEINFFTAEHVKECMKKVIAVNIHETIQVDDELEIRPYYAGHVSLFSIVATNHFRFSVLLCFMRELVASFLFSILEIST